MRSILLAILLSAPLVPAGTATARATCRAEPARADLSVAFLGVSTILVRAGDQAIMVDGFFSRPDLGQTMLARLQPDPGRIGDGLRRARVRRLLALLVAQAHHDHSMDAARVANETGAALLGSPSAVNIFRADGFEDPVTLADGQEYCFGPFHVRAILSPHSPGLIPLLVYGSARFPGPSRRHALAYRDTRNFSFLVSYGNRRILIHPSANHPARGLGDIGADIVFFSIGDLGQRSPAYIDAYWDAVARPSKARLIIPIHWDNFLRPVPPEGEASFHGLPGPLSRGQFDYALRRIQRRAGADCVQVRFLDAYAEMAVERLLSDRDVHLDGCRPEPGRARSAGP